MSNNYEQCGFGINRLKASGGITARGVYDCVNHQSTSAQNYAVKKTKYCKEIDTNNYPPIKYRQCNNSDFKKPSVLPADNPDATINAGTGIQGSQNPLRKPAAIIYENVLQRNDQLKASKNVVKQTAVNDIYNNRIWLFHLINYDGTKTFIIKMFESERPKEDPFYTVYEYIWEKKEITGKTSNNKIVMANHIFITGDKVLWKGPSDSDFKRLLSNKILYVRKKSANEFELYDTKDKAIDTSKTTGIITFGSGKGRIGMDTFTKYYDKTDWNNIKLSRAWRNMNMDSTLTTQEKNSLINTGFSKFPLEELSNGNKKVILENLNWVSNGGQCCQLAAQCQPSTFCGKNLTTTQKTSISVNNSNRCEGIVCSHTNKKDKENCCKPSTGSTSHCIAPDSSGTKNCNFINRPINNKFYPTTLKGVTMYKKNDINISPHRYVSSVSATKANAGVQPGDITGTVKIKAAKNDGFRNISANDEIWFGYKYVKQGGNLPDPPPSGPFYVLKKLDNQYITVNNHISEIRRGGDIDPYKVIVPSVCCQSEDIKVSKCVKQPQCKTSVTNNTCLSNDKTANEYQKTHSKCKDAGEGYRVIQAPGECHKFKNDEYGIHPSGVTETCEIDHNGNCPPNCHKFYEGEVVRSCNSDLGEITKTVMYEPPVRGKGILNTASWTINDLTDRINRYKNPSNNNLMHSRISEKDGENMYINSPNSNFSWIDDSTSTNLNNNKTPPSGGTDVRLNNLKTSLHSCNKQTISKTDINSCGEKKELSKKAIEYLSHPLGTSTTAKNTNYSINNIWKTPLPPLQNAPNQLIFPERLDPNTQDISIMRYPIVLWNGFSVYKNNITKDINLKNADAYGGYESLKKVIINPSNMNKQFNKLTIVPSESHLSTRIGSSLDLTPGEKITIRGEPEQKNMRNSKNMKEIMDDKYSSTYNTNFSQSASKRPTAHGKIITRSINDANKMFKAKLSYSGVTPWCSISAASRVLSQTCPPTTTTAIYDPNKPANTLNGKPINGSNHSTCGLHGMTFTVTEPPPGVEPNPREIYVKEEIPITRNRYPDGNEIGQCYIEKNDNINKPPENLKRPIIECDTCQGGDITVKSLLPHTKSGLVGDLAKQSTGFLVNHTDAGKGVAPELAFSSIYELRPGAPYGGYNKGHDKNAMINQVGAGWIAAGHNQWGRGADLGTSLGGWWQIDLKEKKEILGVQIQTRYNINQKVTFFKVSTSNDNLSWTPVDNGAVFTGLAATDTPNKIVYRAFTTPVKAQYLRIIPTDYHPKTTNQISMRATVKIRNLTYRPEALFKPDLPSTDISSTNLTNKISNYNTNLNTLKNKLKPIGFNGSKYNVKYSNIYNTADTNNYFKNLIYPYQVWFKAPDSAENHKYSVYPKEQLAGGGGVADIWKPLRTTKKLLNTLTIQQDSSGGVTPRPAWDTTRSATAATNMDAAKAKYGEINVYGDNNKQDLFINMNMAKKCGELQQNNCPGASSFACKWDNNAKICRSDDKLRYKYDKCIKCSDNEIPQKYEIDINDFGTISLATSTSTVAPARKNSMFPVRGSPDAAKRKKINLLARKNQEFFVEYNDGSIEGPYYVKKISLVSGSGNVTSFETTLRVDRDLASKNWPPSNPNRKRLSAVGDATATGKVITYTSNHGFESGLTVKYKGNIIDGLNDNENYIVYKDDASKIKLTKINNPNEYITVSTRTLQASEIIYSSLEYIIPKKLFFYSNNQQCIITKQNTCNYEYKFKQSSDTTPTALPSGRIKIVSGIPNPTSGSTILNSCLSCYNGFIKVPQKWKQLSTKNTASTPRFVPSKTIKLSINSNGEYQKIKVNDEIYIDSISLSVGHTLEIETNTIYYISRKAGTSHNTGNAWFVEISRYPDGPSLEASTNQKSQNITDVTVNKWKITENRGNNNCIPLNKAGLNHNGQIKGDGVPVLSLTQVNDGERFKEIDSCSHKSLTNGAPPAAQNKTNHYLESGGGVYSMTGCKCKWDNINYRSNSIGYDCACCGNDENRPGGGLLLESKYGNQTIPSAEKRDKYMGGHYDNNATNSHLIKDDKLTLQHGASTISGPIYTSPPSKNIGFISPTNPNLSKIKNIYNDDNLDNKVSQVNWFLGYGRMAHKFLSYAATASPPASASATSPESISPLGNSKLLDNLEERCDINRGNERFSCGSVHWNTPPFFGTRNQTRIDAKFGSTQTNPEWEQTGHAYPANCQDKKSGSTTNNLNGTRCDQFTNKSGINDPTTGRASTTMPTNTSVKYLKSHPTIQIEARSLGGSNPSVSKRKSEEILPKGIPSRASFVPGRSCIYKGVHKNLTNNKGKNIPLLWPDHIDLSGTTKTFSDTFGIDQLSSIKIGPGSGKTLDPSTVGINKKVAQPGCYKINDAGVLDGIDMNELDRIKCDETPNRLWLDFSGRIGPHRCKLKQCFCDDYEGNNSGIGASGDKCDWHGKQKCRTCNVGYGLSLKKENPVSFPPWDSDKKLKGAEKMPGIPKVIKVDNIDGVPTSTKVGSSHKDIELKCLRCPNGYYTKIYSSKDFNTTPQNILKTQTITGNQTARGFICTKKKCNCLNGKGGRNCPLISSQPLRGGHGKNTLSIKPEGSGNPIFIDYKIPGTSCNICEFGYGFTGPNDNDNKISDTFDGLIPTKPGSLYFKNNTFTATGGHATKYNTIKKNDEIVYVKPYEYDVNPAPDTRWLRNPTGTKPPTTPNYVSPTPATDLAAGGNPRRLYSSVRDYWMATAAPQGGSNNDGRMNTGGSNNKNSWSPNTISHISNTPSYGSSDNNPWMQIQVGATEQIIGIKTKGRDLIENTNKDYAYVTSYRIQVSEQKFPASNQLFDVKNEDGGLIFEGNHDGNTEKKHIFTLPIDIKYNYIRIYPKGFNIQISMRASVIVTKPDSCKDAGSYKIDKINNQEITLKGFPDENHHIEDSWDSKNINNKCQIVIPEQYISPLSTLKFNNNGVEELSGGGNPIKVQNLKVRGNYRKADRVCKKCPDGYVTKHILRIPVKKSDYNRSKNRITNRSLNIETVATTTTIYVYGKEMFPIGSVCSISSNNCENEKYIVIGKLLPSDGDPTKYQVSPGAQSGDYVFFNILWENYGVGIPSFKELIKQSAGDTNKIIFSSQINGKFNTPAQFTANTVYLSLDKIKSDDSSVFIQKEPDEGNCLPDQKIKSATECKKAAEYLGYDKLHDSTKGITRLVNANKPPGCYLMTNTTRPTGTGMEVFFNSSKTPKTTATEASICSDKAPHHIEVKSVCQLASCKTCTGGAIATGKQCTNSGKERLEIKISRLTGCPNINQTYTTKDQLLGGSAAVRVNCESITSMAKCGAVGSASAQICEKNKAILSAAHTCTPVFDNTNPQITTCTNLITNLSGRPTAAKNACHSLKVLSTEKQLYSITGSASKCRYTPAVAAVSAGAKCIPKDPAASPNVWKFKPSLYRIVNDNFDHCKIIKGPGTPRAGSKNICCGNLPVKECRKQIVKNTGTGNKCGTDKEFNKILQLSNEPAHQVINSSVDITPSSGLIFEKLNKIYKNEQNIEHENTCNKCTGRKGFKYGNPYKSNILHTPPPQPPSSRTPNTRAVSFTNDGKLEGTQVYSNDETTTRPNTTPNIQTGEAYGLGYRVMSDPSKYCPTHVKIHLGLSNTDIDKIINLNEQQKTNFKNVLKEDIAIIIGDGPNTGSSTLTGNFPYVGQRGNFPERLIDIGEIYKTNNNQLEVNFSFRRVYSGANLAESRWFKPGGRTPMPNMKNKFPNKSTRKTFTKLKTTRTARNDYGDNIRSVFNSGIPTTLIQDVVTEIYDINPKENANNLNLCDNNRKGKCDLKRCLLAAKTLGYRINPSQTYNWWMANGGCHLNTMNKQVTFNYHSGNTTAQPNIKSICLAAPADMKSGQGMNFKGPMTQKRVSHQSKIKPTPFPLRNVFTDFRSECTDCDAGYYQINNKDSSFCKEALCKCSKGSPSKGKQCALARTTISGGINRGGGRTRPLSEPAFASQYIKGTGVGGDGPPTREVCDKCTDGQRFGFKAGGSSNPLKFNEDGKLETDTSISTDTISLGPSNKDYKTECALCDVGYNSIPKTTPPSKGNRSFCKKVKCSGCDHLNETGTTTTSRPSQSATGKMCIDGGGNHPLITHPRSKNYDVSSHKVCKSCDPGYGFMHSNNSNAMLIKKGDNDKKWYLDNKGTRINTNPPIENTDLNTFLNKIPEFSKTAASPNGGVNQFKRTCKKCPDGYIGYQPPAQAGVTRRRFCVKVSCECLGGEGATGSECSSLWPAGTSITKLKGYKCKTGNCYGERKLHNGHCKIHDQRGNPVVGAPEKYLCGSARGGASEKYSIGTNTSAAADIKTHNTSGLYYKKDSYPGCQNYLEYNDFFQPYNRNSNEYKFNNNITTDYENSCSSRIPEDPNTVKFCKNLQGTIGAGVTPPNNNNFTCENVKFKHYIYGYEQLKLERPGKALDIKPGTFISQKTNGIITDTAQIVRVTNTSGSNKKDVFIIYTKKTGGFVNPTPLSGKTKIIIGDTTKSFHLKETDIRVTSKVGVRDPGPLPSNPMANEKVCYELKENIGNYILTIDSSGGASFQAAVTKGKHIKDPSNNDKILGVIIQRISNTQIRVMLLKPNSNTTFNSFIRSGNTPKTINMGIKIGTTSYKIKKIENSPTIDLTGGKLKPPSRPAGTGSAPEFGACINKNKPLVAASQKDDTCYKVDYGAAIAKHSDAKAKCEALQIGGVSGVCKYMKDYFKLDKTHNFITNTGANLSGIPDNLGSPPKYNRDTTKRFTNNELLRFDYVPETPDGSYPTDIYNLKISSMKNSRSPPVLKVRGGIHKCQPHIGCNKSRPECSNYIDYIDNRTTEVTQAKNNFKIGKATCLPNMNKIGLNTSDALECLKKDKKAICEAGNKCKWINDKHKRRELLGFMKRRFNKCQQTHPGYNFTSDDKNLNQSIGTYLQTFR